MTDEDASSRYRNKTIMAPMVRAGRTPLRLLALDYGADLVYTEEIVDQKLLGCQRIINTTLDTIDYRNDDDIVLRIATKKEEGKCILQIGTNNGISAAQVANIIGTDVSGIDVNMGCPKPFSIHAGMGAALLKETDKIKDILTSLVATAKVPVTCKIRVLDNPSETLCLVREIEKCGVSALGVHGRRRDERNPDACRYDEIREVVRTVSLPIIANGGSGEINCYADIESFRDKTNASSVMLARKALNTPSIFRKEGVLSFDEDVKNFLDLACEFDENYTMTKYVVQRILGSAQEFDVRGRQSVLAGSVLDLCRAWGIEDKYDHHKRERDRRKCKRKNDQIEISNDGIHLIDVTFPMKRLKDAQSSAETPKTVLYKYCIERGLNRPLYSTIQRTSDKRFEGIVEVADKKYQSRKGQANIRMAEQVAALAALIGLEQRDRLVGEWEEN